MPELGLKSSKPHNFSTVSPNVTCTRSLESYHPYLQPQIVSKNPPKITITTACPNQQKIVLAYIVL
jgi:hypothetical protein